MTQITSYPIGDLLQLSTYNSKTTSGFLSNSNKIRRIANFDEVFNRMKNESANKKDPKQKDVCKEIGVSVTTMNRMRKDLGVVSPYRYATTINKTEAQAERDKYKRLVYNALRKNYINEDTKLELYTQINEEASKGKLTKEFKNRIENTLEISKNNYISNPDVTPRDIEHPTLLEPHSSPLSSKLKATTSRRTTSRKTASNTNAYPMTAGSAISGEHSSSAISGEHSSSAIDLQDNLALARQAINSNLTSDEIIDKYV